MSTQHKVFAISSPGGHWIQLTRLCAGLEAQHQIVYGVLKDILKDQLHALKLKTSAPS